MSKKSILKAQIKTTISEENIPNIKMTVFSVIRETIGDLKAERCADIKTALNEALDNVIHAYQRKKQGRVVISTNIYDDKSFDIKVQDFGSGIEDVEKAMEPLFSTNGGSGMGFVFMEAFSKRVTVESTPGKGTIITLEF